jgi:transposase
LRPEPVFDASHDPWTYLKDVLTRLPTQLNSRIDELLPHLWQPAT